ncbi:MAG: DNA topoisomerase [Clostridia bacterium]|nr:DNA topoisomerase [Clostridia bacterium]
MDVLITDNKRIAENMAKVLKVPFDVTKSMFIDNEIAIIDIGDDFFNIEINQVGKRMLGFTINDKKITISVNVKEYTEVNKINKLLKQIDKMKIYNCCRSNPKGQFNFQIIKFLCFPQEEYIKRIWFTKQNVKDIKEALNNPKDNEDYKSLAYGYLTESIIDKYWYYRSKDITKTDTKINIKNLFLLKLIWDREKVIKKFESNSYFRIQVLYNEDMTGKWYDRCNNDRLYSLDEVKSIIGHIQNKDIFITKAEVKISEKQQPLLYNQSDILKEIIKIKAIDENKYKNALNKLYINGYISNPNTNSRHIKENMKDELVRILESVKQAPEYHPYIKYITHINYGFVDKVFNDKYVDNNHAILPTTKIPLNIYDLTEEESLIYDLIIKRFLTMFMDKQKIAKISVKGTIDTDNKIKTENIKTINEGFNLVNLRNIDIYQLIKDIEEGKDTRQKINIKAGDVFKILKVEVVDDGTRPPSRYRKSTLIKLMDNCGKAVKSEEKRVQLRALGIGRTEDRPDIIQNLLDRKYIELKEDKIYLTESGEEIIKSVPNRLLSLKILEIFNTRIVNVNKGIEELTIVIKEHLEYIDKILKESPRAYKFLSINYREVLSKYSCPYCSNELKDRGEFIGCKDWKNCKFKLPKVKKGYILKEKDLESLITIGKTDLIVGFHFKNTKKGKAYLKRNDNKKWIEFEFLNKVKQNK